MNQAGFFFYEQDKNFFNKIKNRLKKINVNFRTILFIEPLGAILSVLAQAIMKKYNIVILSANAGLCVAPESVINSAHLSIQINTRNEKEMFSLIEGLRQLICIHAVIPGFEYFVPIAAKISHFLRLSGIPKEHVMKLCRKDSMRMTLASHEIRMPKFYLVHSIAELRDAIDFVGLPAVCKPVNATGSINVRRVVNYKEAYAVSHRILGGNHAFWGHRIENILLFEEYISGKEYSLEGIIQNGQVHFFSITEKFVADDIEFIAVGRVANAPVSAEFKKESEIYIEKIIHALCIDNCPFHAEVKVDSMGRPILMEIAGRVAEDHIGELINLAKSINYFNYILDVYLGNAVKKPIMENHFAGIRFFYRPHIAKYLTISGLPKINHEEIAEIQFYYQSKQVIRAFPKIFRRLGHVIAYGDNYYHLLNILNDIDMKIKFHGGVPRSRDKNCLN